MTRAASRTEAASPESMASVRPPAGPYVVKKLRELDAALAEAIPRVVQASDDEAIHDLRVAIRRLRTMLKMARPLFGRWHADVVRKAFADVMKATGDLRDEEVLEETLEDLIDAPAFKSWLRARSAREKKLRKAVVTRIERGELDRARLMLKALLVFPFDPERNAPLSKFARKTVERARRTVEKGRDVPPDDVVGLHDLRISYKELRYAIELLSEALPLDARAMLDPAVVFQKRLGEIHDADVAAEVLEAATALPEGVRHAATAALAKVRAKRLHKYLRELDPLGAAPPSAAPKHDAAAPDPAALAVASGDGDGEGDDERDRERDGDRDRDPAADAAAAVPATDVAGRKAAPANGRRAPGPRPDDPGGEAPLPGVVGIAD